MIARAGNSQQRSGVGIEAQRTAIQQFAAIAVLISTELVELENGKGANALDRTPLNLLPP